MYLVKARSEDHVVSQELCFSVITDNFEEIMHIFLASFFLTLKMHVPASKWQHGLYVCCV